MTTMAAPTVGSLSARERREKPVTPPAPRSSTLTDGLLGLREFRLPFPGGQLVIDVPGPLQSWVAPTLDSLRLLLALPPGWDSYGARPIDPACVRAAIDVAFALLNERTPAPVVVPTSSGGVQFEWHTRGIDLEIEVRSPSRISACFEDQRTQTSWDAEQLHDFSRLRDALRELARR